MQNVFSKARLAAALLAPLLFACGSEGAGGGGGFLQVPDCQGTGKVLSTDSSGQFVCKDLPAGAVSLPDCLPDVEALTADGKTLSCTNRNVVDVATKTALDKLVTIEKLIKDYGTTVSMIMGGPGANVAFKGVTDVPVNGAMDSGNGQNPKGIGSATTMCVAKFGAGARMCTVYDIYNAKARGSIGPTLVQAKAWVYMASGKNPGGSTNEGDQSLNDNCGAYTYPTADTKWQGTAVEISSQAFTTSQVLRFWGNTPCSTKLPIACCQ